jgi:hypothetical protein
MGLSFQNTQRRPEPVKQAAESSVVRRFLVVSPHDNIRHQFLACVNVWFRHFFVEKRHVNGLIATLFGLAMQN